MLHGGNLSRLLIDIELLVGSNRRSVFCMVKIWGKIIRLLRRILMNQIDNKSKLILKEESGSKKLQYNSRQCR